MGCFWSASLCFTKKHCLVTSGYMCSDPRKFISKGEKQFHLEMNKAECLKNYKCSLCKHAPLKPQLQKKEKKINKCFGKSATSDSAASQLTKN